MYILVAILLIIVLVFGVSSGMQSYAMARQAQAQIEVAQVAQVNAWGNLIVILLLALVIVSVLAFIVWMIYSRQRSTQSSTFSRQRQPSTSLAKANQSEVSTDDLFKLVLLKHLTGGYQIGVDPAPGKNISIEQEVEVKDGDLYWLR